MLYEDKKDFLIDDAWNRILKLPDDFDFTVEQLYSTDEWEKLSVEKRRFLTSELQYYIRVRDEEHYWQWPLVMMYITEISEGAYRKAKPEFEDCGYFNKETSIQELFDYTYSTIRQYITYEDNFQLKDLFPCYVWARLSQKQKVSLGLLLQRYNTDSGQATFARIDITKQGQNIYQGLCESENTFVLDWADVDISCPKIHSRYEGASYKYRQDPKVSNLLQKNRK